MDQEGSASVNAVQKGDALSTKQKGSKAPARQRDIPLTIAPACRNGSTHTTANRKECEVYVANSASQSLESVKKCVADAPILRYYDVKEEATIQCDALQKGLGATLLQKGQPVAFAFRSLSLTEQHYAQTEKECLAIVFACEHFNRYTHGRESTTIHTDHKPLVTIFNKPIHSAPKRLQRMILRLQKYHLALQYCPGSKIYKADMLSRSRAYIINDKEIKEKDYDVFRLEHEE